MYHFDISEWQENKKHRRILKIKKTWDLLIQSLSISGGREIKDLYPSSHSCLVTHKCPSNWPIKQNDSARCVGLQLQLHKVGKWSLEIKKILKKIRRSMIMFLEAYCYRRAIGLLLRHRKMSLDFSKNNPNLKKRKKILPKFSNKPILDYALLSKKKN